MARRRQTPELVALRNSLRRWRTLVESSLRRRGTCRRIDSGAYHVSHRELLEACQACANVADETERPLIHRLVELVRAWKTPEVLARADVEILGDLITRCRQAERLLDYRAWLRSAVRWGVLSLALAFALVVGCKLLMPARIADRVWLSMPGGMRHWLDRIWASIQPGDDLRGVLIAAVVAVLIAIYVVWHSART